MLVIMVWVVGGCGFCLRRGVFGDFFVDVAGGVFFGGVDWHFGCGSGVGGVSRDCGVDGLDEVAGWCG